MLSIPCPEWVVLLAASINAAVVMYEADDRFSHEDDTRIWMSLTSMLVITLYICEVAYRASKQQQEFFFNVWNVLDCIVIFVDAANEMVALAIGKVPSAAALLVLRIARLAQPVFWLSSYPGPRGLAYSMLSATKAAAWGALLLAVVISIWAMVAAQVLQPLNRDIADDGEYVNCHWCADAFSSVAHSWLTLIRHMILVDDWGRVLVVIIKKHSWTAVFFFSAFISINVGIFSLVIATMVSKVNDASSKGVALKPEVAKHENGGEQLLLDICSLWDDDCAGMTIEKLVKAFENSTELRNFLKPLGVSRDDLQLLYTILDAEGVGNVSRKLFVDQLLRMQAGSSENLLMFIQLYSAKAQQKVEEQIIWLMQRYEAMSSQPKLSTVRHRADTADSLREPLVRVPTPFGTFGTGMLATSSDYSQSPFGTPTHINRNSRTKDVTPPDFGSRLQDLAQAGDKLTTSPMVGANSYTHMVSELEFIRQMIDVKLDFMVRELSREADVGTRASKIIDFQQASQVANEIKDRDIATSMRSAAHRLTPVPGSLPENSAKDSITALESNPNGGSVEASDVEPTAIATPLEASVAQARTVSKESKQRERKNQSESKALPKTPATEESTDGNDFCWKDRWQKVTNVAGRFCCEAGEQGKERLVVIAPTQQRRSPKTTPNQSPRRR